MEGRRLKPEQIRGNLQLAPGAGVYLGLERSSGGNAGASFFPHLYFCWEQEPEKGPDADATVRFLMSIPAAAFDSPRALTLREAMDLALDSEELNYPLASEYAVEYFALHVHAPESDPSLSLEFRCGQSVIMGTVEELEEGDLSVFLTRRKEEV